MQPPFMFACATRQLGCFLTLQKQSHLYKNVGALVGAYLRIDIPKLPHFDQYNYVLFTGVWRWPRKNFAGCSMAGAAVLVPMGQLL